jgi:nitroimidazol reductase NimA-like FMN-containing flavoprotein (pyridoxamine 5'-phosphate oxidase superfamily)
LGLAAISPEAWPVKALLWFEFHDGAFYCTSKMRSRIVNLLQKNMQTGFEVVVEKPPCSGVRGQGVAGLGI